MHPLIQRKQSFSLFFVALALLCFGLSPCVQAVSPEPDGGYPGGNTAEGGSALLNLTSGTYNTAVGFLSLQSNATGGFNTAIGAGALYADTGQYNTATGAGALLHNMTGSLNTAIGEVALFSNTTGSINTAMGQYALFSNTIGNDNVANGVSALSNNTEGINNTACGAYALDNNTTGNGNIALGTFTGGNVTTATNVICIGVNVAGANVNNTCFIGNIRGVHTVNNNAIPVLIDSAGQLGTISSSQMFKHDIKPMDNASEAILALKPVTFHYKSDNTNRPEFGLVAEEVAEVNPDLVVRDNKGEIYTVRYDAVNAMLLNEFLKQHKTVQEQGATIANLQKQIEALTAGLQKVSAQVEMNRAATQMVVNER
jgi:hypothetical protein